jgi:hypothetical protein
MLLGSLVVLATGVGFGVAFQPKVKHFGAQVKHSGAQVKQK